MSELVVDKHDLAEQIARKQLEIQKLQDEVTALKDYFRDDSGVMELGKPGRATIRVKVSPNSRIDDTLAKRVLDEPTYTALSKRVIDTTKARAFLDSETLAEITKTFDNKVEVTVI